MTMPPRLTVVGDLERSDHCHLPADARCYFWGEYTRYEDTGGLNWNYSPTNQLITNFKKKLERKGLADWHHKGRAVATVAQAFAGFWQWAQLHQQHRVVIVPIPPSKARADPLFDGRMHEMLLSMAMRAGVPLDIRDCLSFSGAYGASHEMDDRPSPDDLYAELALDPAVAQPQAAPGVIFLFDDMLTTGAHYVAAARKLGEVFPGVPIVGNFIARRRLPNPFADFDEA